MIDITRKYKTRDGSSVELLSDKGRGGYPIIGYIDTLSDEELRTWFSDGRVNHQPGSEEHPWDLIEVPETATCYLNVRMDTSGIHSYLCSSEKAAIEGANSRAHYKNSCYLVVAKVVEIPKGYI